MIAKPIRNSRRNHAFSLMEMIVVMTVVAFLLALAAPNLVTMMKGNELSTQGDILRNQLSLAQQRALSTNADVEVRFFRFADENNAQTDPQYRAMQFYQYNEQGQLVPISEIYRLSTAVVFSERYSNLLTGDVNSGTVDGQTIFGSGVQGGVTYKSFRFRPDGSTDLTQSQQTWYITMMPDLPGAGNTGEMPDNFFTIQVDAFNGSLKEFRP